MRRHLASGPSDELPIWPILWRFAASSERGPNASGRGQRVDAHPPSSVRRGPDSERIRASFISDFNRPARWRRAAIDGSHHRRRWTLFNNSLRDDLRYWPMVRLANFADVAQQAERDHAMVEATSSRLVIRSTSGVSFHSAAARHGVGGAGCARPKA
jgi:hypothetical protein